MKIISGPGETAFEVSSEQGNRKMRRLSSILIVTSIVVVLPRAPCAEHDPNYRRPLRYETSSAAGPMIFLSPLPHFFFPFCFSCPGETLWWLFRSWRIPVNNNTHTPSLVPLSLSIKDFMHTDIRHRESGTKVTWHFRHVRFPCPVVLKTWTEK